MKQKLFQFLMCFLLTGLLFSCKKEIEPVAQHEPDVLAEPAMETGNQSVASLTATKKLQKIMWNASTTTPFAAFTYDAKGRLAKVGDAYGDITTYTYKDTTVLIKRKKPGVAKALDSLVGKLNSKGHLYSLKGYTTLGFGGQTNINTHSNFYTYNSAGQLTKISSATKSNGITTYVKHYITWLNGNLTAVKTTMNTGYTSTTINTYDAAKTDKRGVWTNDFFPFWTDNLLGIRTKNLLLKAVTTDSGGSTSQSTQTWTLNAEGYPASSTLGYGGFVATFTYTFQ
jgi:hypothetical protein